MPPIKRNQKPATPPRRRVAGRPAGTPTGPADAAGQPARGARREPAVADTEPAVGGHPPGGPATREAGERRGRGLPVGLVLAVLAVVVGLVAGVAGITGIVLARTGDDTPNRAFVDREATDEVLTAASTNVQRLVSIDHEELDAYHDSLDEFLTPDLVAKLDENWATLKDTYEQTETEVDAQVREAGVTHLSGDSAEVLLVQDVSMSRGGQAAGSTIGTYLVGLDRIDGVWKLSRIPDLPS